MCLYPASKAIFAASPTSPGDACQVSDHKYGWGGISQILFSQYERSQQGRLRKAFDYQTMDRN